MCLWSAHNTFLSLSLSHSLTNSYQKQISSTHSFIYVGRTKQWRMEISKTHLSGIPDDDEVGRWLLSTHFADMYFVHENYGVEG